MREAIRSGWKGSSASVFSPTPTNRIGLPVTVRTERRTAARIAVGLGEHYAGERQRPAEGSRRIDGVLTRHGVDHEQRLDRYHRTRKLAHLRHHLLVDVQASRVSTINTS
jgi:hypothetical protein